MFKHNSVVRHRATRFLSRTSDALFRRFLLSLCLWSLCVGSVATATCTLAPPPPAEPLYGWEACAWGGCFLDYTGLRLPLAEACNHYAVNKPGMLVKDPNAQTNGNAGPLCADWNNATPDGYCRNCGSAFVYGMRLTPYCPSGYDLWLYPYQAPICRPPSPKPLPYRIQLLNDSGQPGSSYLGEVKPDGNVSLKARVTCGDGEPVSGAQVELKVDVIDQTGGHQHPGGGRPLGSIRYPGWNTTDNDGYLPFTFYAPSPAGDHWITARCIDRDCDSDSGKVWVGIRGLVSLYDTYLYKLVGSDDAHPGNHYLTWDAMGSVVSLAWDYHSEFTSDPVLHFNDASLERGGLFDISANWSTGPRGHKSHRRGDIVDIRANPDVYPDTAIPVRNFNRFEDLACRLGGEAEVHSPGLQNQHYHVVFQGCRSMANVALIDALPYLPPVTEGSPSPVPGPAPDPCAGPNPDPSKCY